MNYQSEQLQKDLKLIKEVERHTNLYNLRCKSKNSKSRDDTWYTIGKNLNLAPDACKNRWKSLRDKYTREKKLMMLEGEENYRMHPWPLLDEMSFLWNFVSHRSRPNIKLEYLSSDCDKNSLPSKCIESTINYSDCDETSIKSNLLDPTCVLVEEDEPIETNPEDCTPYRPKLRKLLEKENENSESQMDCNDHQVGRPVFKLPQPVPLMDEEEYFCMSLAASLRRLPKKTSSLLKIKIMQILYDAQFGENKKQ